MDHRGRKNLLKTRALAEEVHPSLGNRSKRMGGKQSVLRYAPNPVEAPDVMSPGVPMAGEERAVIQHR